MKRIPVLLCVVLALALASCEQSSMCPDPPCSTGDSDTTSTSSIDKPD